MGTPFRPLLWFALVTLLMDASIHFGLRVRSDAVATSTRWAEVARDVVLAAGSVLALAVLLKGNRRAKSPAQSTLAQDAIVQQEVQAYRAGERGTGDDETVLARKEQELNAARLEAQNARRAAAEILASMSHEIRTPITAILGFAELLVDDQSHPTPQTLNADAIRTIRKQGSHLLGVINGVLDLAKIESGKMQIESTRCSPAQLVEEVHALFAARAATMGLSLSVEQQFPLPDIVLSDPLRIRQVLVNLVGNALKFTPPPPHSPGRIVLRLFAHRDTDRTPSLVFECSDTGQGISDDLAPKIFEPFTQSNASAAREFGGSGLGLSICHRFAKLLGGTIAFRRHENAPGTTFVLTLPMCEAPDTKWLQAPQHGMSRSSPEIGASVPSPELPTLRGRVLLVEDSPDIQRLISYLLTKAGASVELAENGRFALELARSVEGRTRYDLVLMDMQMPELDGYGAATELRAAGFRQPIIALTANALDGDRQRCLDAGCSDYLSKPVDRRTLLDTCAKWMRHARSAHASAARPTQPVA